MERSFEQQQMCRRMGRTMDAGKLVLADKGKEGWLMKPNWKEHSLDLFDPATDTRRALVDCSRLPMTWNAATLSWLGASDKDFLARS